MGSDYDNEDDQLPPGVERWELPDPPQAPQDDLPDRPGRFIHTSMRAGAARRQRKEDLRAETKRRVTDAFNTAMYTKQSGNRFAPKSAEQKSSSAAGVRPTRGARMPQAQTIGYPSSSGWSFGPGVNFSTRR